jgi:hypothetical protein
MRDRWKEDLRLAKYVYQLPKYDSEPRRSILEIKSNYFEIYRIPPQHKGKEKVAITRQRSSP